MLQPVGSRRLSFAVVCLWYLLALDSSSIILLQDLNELILLVIITKRAKFLETRSIINGSFSQFGLYPYVICSLYLQGEEASNTDQVCEEVKDDTGMSVRSCKNSSVFSSLPLAIKWLRDAAQKDRCVRFQVVIVFWDYICLRLFGLLLQIFACHFI